MLACAYLSYWVKGSRVGGHHFTFCRRRFTKVPIGPIGAHLTLTDGKWATAAEEGLGGQLETWIAHNRQDQQVRTVGGGAARCSSMCDRLHWHVAKGCGRQHVMHVTANVNSLNCIFTLAQL